MSRPPWGVRDLTVRYGGRTALERVTLEVPAGAVTAVIGGDGAGKTTLLRALAGVVHPAAGVVRRPARERLGYVSGSQGIYHDLTVAENAAFVARAFHLGREDAETRTRELLALTGLDGAEDRLAGRLSGGMRQKLAVALATLHRPQLLVLDEPTTGVDPVSRADLWRLIAGAAAGGAGVVISTTYPDEAERASSMLELDAGRAVTGDHAGDAHAAGTGGAATASGSTRPIASRLHAERAPGSVVAAARHVTRRFGELTAVAGVDLLVAPGEVVGLLGANGAGKTTLIRMLLGLLRPTAGSVELFGRAPSRQTRARLGYVPQTLGLWQDLSVAENVAFSCRAFAVAAPRLEPELASAADMLVRDLPLGLRRRLAFAVALAHRPELLVLDEPTTGVDPRAGARLWSTVHKAAAEGAAVLVTTHHLEEAGECHRLMVMAAGHVVAEGTHESIVGGRRAVAVQTDAWPAALAALERAGLPAALVGRGLRVPGGALEDVRAALDTSGVAARLSLDPATLEETFVLLARAGARAVTADPEGTTA